MPVAEERLEPVRNYLRNAFPNWELADQWDGHREAHSFRLILHGEPVHLLKVSREFFEDSELAEIALIIEQRGVANALRHSAEHRVLLTNAGLSELPPP
jgi:hypothetical protein